MNETALLPGALVAAGGHLHTRVLHYTRVLSFLLSAASKATGRHSTLTWATPDTPGVAPAMYSSCVVSPCCRAQLLEKNKVLFIDENIFRRKFNLNVKNEIKICRTKQNMHTK